MKRLAALKVLKKLLEAKGWDVGIANDDSARRGEKSRSIHRKHYNATAKQKREEFEALKYALDIIREVNAADSGDDRFCPRCEERPAAEGVCGHCDSDIMDDHNAHPGARS